MAQEISHTLQNSSFKNSSMSKEQALRYHIKQTVYHYAQSMHWSDFQEEISVWLPKSAQKLPACKQKINFHSANQNRPPLGRMHYSIECDSPKWQIRARAKVKLWLDVWHAKNDIAVDQVLSLKHIFLKNIEISRLNQQFFTTKQSIENKRSTRRIRANKVISSSKLENIYLVKKGEEVLIRAQTGNFIASMKGIALKHGMMGERIKVENVSSKKKIQAKVVAEGIVETIF